MSSPLQAEFFGESLRCVLASTVTNIEVGPQLYSQWKEWTKIGDNAKYPEMFRIVGGDPLTPGIDAGSYFFINNVEGWRIRPAEENATVLIVGNLAPEDSAIPIAVPTLGGYTVMLLGLQPITQNVDRILVISEDSLYTDARVWIDTVDGVSGVSFPAGTPGSPVLTLSDAKAIIAARGLPKRIAFKGSLFPGTEDISGFDIKGDHYHTSTLSLAATPAVASLFTNVHLSGAATAVSGYHVVTCALDNVSNFAGEAHYTEIEGTIVLISPNENEFQDCYTGVADVAVIDCNDLVNLSLSFKRHAGAIELRNVSDAGSMAVIDLASGHVILDSTCTAGTIIVRGVGHLTDNSGSGCNVEKTGLVSGEDVSLTKALVAGDAVVSLDDQTVTIYDDGVSPRQILAIYNISVDGRVRTRTS